MSFKNIKLAPLFLSASVVTLSGLSSVSRVYAAQLNLNSPANSLESDNFAVPFDSTLQESGLIESASDNAEVAGFNCNFSPEGAGQREQPEGEVLSHLGPNLVAQAGAPFQISQFSGAEQGPIIGEMCELEGAPIGGVGGGGFPFPALAGLAPLGLLGLIGGGDGGPGAPAPGAPIIPPIPGPGPDPTPPAVPEPLAIPFIFSALGIGAVVARKRRKSSKTK